mgnify:CR=1 FL=1
MNKLRPLLFAAIVFTFFSSCEKEYSAENSGAPSSLIVGLDCRISKILYTDTATNTGIGYLSADINSVDIVTKIIKYDSLSNTLEFYDQPTYSNDTVFINVDEYFVVDATRRIAKLHGLVDPTDPLSLQFDIFYVYNGTGYLIAKNYFLTSAPTIPFYRIDYTYAFGNLTHMMGTDLSNGDLIIDADLNYFTNIVPKRYLYLFPDEKAYPYFSQFYNYGLKSHNAIKKMTVRNYDPGSVVRDSSVSNFSNYIMSRDTYVLSVQMTGDEQQSIPASASKLTYSYHCK